MCFLLKVIQHSKFLLNKCNAANLFQHKLLLQASFLGLNKVGSEQSHVLCETRDCSFFFPKDQLKIIG